MSEPRRNPLPSVSVIDLTTYNKKYGPDISAGLFVLNRSNQGADIAFNAVGDNGRSVAIMIPNSFAPIDLTMFATREGLLKSSDFRTLLTKQYLSIVDNESAQAALKDPRVEKEYNRIFQINKQEGASEGSITLGTDTVVANNGLDKVDVNQYEEPPMVTEMLAMARENPDDKDGIENVFLNKATQLKATDLAYIAQCNVSQHLTDLALDEAATRPA